ncbi:MAG: DUF2062 domain-containing protein [Nitratireductor sp.]
MAKRIFRLTASPHAVAAGVSAGVFASFTPFFGLHFMIAFAVAYLIGGNFIAAAMGTFFGNPLTFPFIAAGTWSTGRFILSGAHIGSFTGQGHTGLGEITEKGLFTNGFTGFVERISQLWEPIILPWSVGAVPLGIAFGIVFYVLTRSASVRFRAARLRRLEARAIAQQKAASIAAAEIDQQQPATPRQFPPVTGKINDTAA